MIILWTGATRTRGLGKEPLGTSITVKVNENLSKQVKEDTLREDSFPSFRSLTLS